MAKIAAIPTALVIDGQRKVYPVGSELPDTPALSEHDARELLASGALRDDAIEAARAQAQQAGQKAADAEFQRARAALAAAEASTQPPAPDAADTADTADAAGTHAKPPAKTARKG